MASDGPPCVDVTEYQFKLHQKSTIFNIISDLRSNINLLASSSNYGLIFVGDPYKPEFKVLQHQNIVDASDSAEKVLARNISLPGIPNNIAVSCDGLLLAVSYTQNKSDFLGVFNVPSFWTLNIEMKFNIRVHQEDNAHVIQILWNPVISNTFALILSNGAVGMYNLKDNSYEFHSLDKNEQAKCACWSPKGKQIVIGFPAGKLIQFKPDLKPAKTIPCPANIHEGPFDTIAVQWLSTYQFAVVFLQQGEDKMLSLYILNAPKNGNQTYINYNDICYSATGPRQAQIFFTHIQPWNILLMASANSCEVGILGTKEAGETPTWQQYITPDEARIELPLTSDKQESFPIGIAFDTGSTHQLTIGETKIPVMPMIHILSTHGQLISFNFLNLIPDAPGICSPPNPVSNTSLLFKPIEEILNSGNNKIPVSQPVAETKTNQPSDVSFSLSLGATSTPSVDRKSNTTFGDGNSSTLFGGSTVSKPLFGPPSSAATGIKHQLTSENSPFSMQSQQQQQSTNLFGKQPQMKNSVFGGTGVTTSTNFGLNLSQTTVSNQQEGSQLSFGKPLAQSKPVSFVAQQNQETVKTKPLYTVPPTFTPPTQQQKPLLQQSTQQQQQQFQTSKVQDKVISSQNTLNVSQQSDSELNDIIRQMIETQINAFEKELCELSAITSDLNISTEEIEETKNFTKRLDNLKELSDRAKDGGIESDVQTLRHSLNECFTMVTEVKSKLNMYKNPHLTQLANTNQTSRRQLAKLKQFIAVNEFQLNMVNQLMDAQWSNYQDLVHQNSTKRKYMPNLEGIYQTMIRQKDIIAQGRAKLNYFKSKLGIKGLLDNTQKVEQNIDINSLVDSILSMSLSDQVQKESSRLTEEKLKIIRETVKNRQIIKIKPQRPDRIGLNSEVILEAKAKTIKKQLDEMKAKSGKDQKTAPVKPIPTKDISTLSANSILKPISQQQQQLRKTEIIKQQQQINQPQSQASPIQIASVQKYQQVKTPQQISQFSAAAITTTPSFPSAGSSFVKPSIPSQSGLSIFSGVSSSQPTIFGGDKSLDQTKPLFGSLTITPVPPVDANLDKSKSSSGPSFGIGKIDNTAKESTAAGAISFAPKVVDNEQTFNFGFVTIQDENKLSSPETVKNLLPPKTTTIAANTINNNKQTTSTVSSQPSLFSPLNVSGFSSVADNKQLFLGTGFGGILSPNDMNKNQAISTTVVTQSTPLLSSGSLTFGGLSLSTKSDVDTTAKEQELPPTPASSSTSSDSLTSTASVSESVTLSATNTNAPPSFSFAAIQKPATTTTTAVMSATTTATSLSSPLSGLVSNSTTGPTTAMATPSFSNVSFGAITTAPASLTSETAPTDLSVKSSISTNEQANILQGLNICKPSASETSTSTQSSVAPANVFDGNLFGGKPITATATETKTLFGSTNTTSSSGLTFGGNVTSTAPLFSGVPIPSNTPAGLSFGGTTATPASSSVFGNTTSTAPLFGTTTLTTPVTSVFGGGTATTTAPLFGTVTSTTPATSIFGATVVSSQPASSASAFGTTSPANSVFGNAAVTSTATIFGGNVPTTSSTPLFGTTTSAFGTPTATTSSSGLFSSVPKPTASAFGSSGVASFTANATTPLFGAQAVSSAGSIFGGAASTTPAFGTTAAFGSNTASQSTSPFGTTANTAPSLFGSPKSETSTNLFGTISQSNAASGGSLFGASSFSNTGQAGSIFGGGGSGTQSSGFGSAFGQPSTNSPFGGTSTQQSSPFGGDSSAGPGASTVAFGQSNFGSPSSFGQASGGFGSTSPGGGTFAQGGPSVAQTGFGSPVSFSKPAFGGSPTFGGAPTFGNSPTFGGAPTFGSSKPTFGGFGTANTGAFSPPSQKNNLFESLGSSDTGLSFGNLAQSTTANAASKPQFGGSSFSSWR